MKKYIELFFDKVLGNFIKIFGILMVLIVILQVLARYLPGNMFTWTEEVARLTFLWFSFISAGIALSKKVHLSVDYFYNKMPVSVKKISDCFCILGIMVISFLMTYYGFLLVNVVHMQKSPILRIPMSYFYIPVPIAGLIFIIYLISDVVDRITCNLKQKKNKAYKL